MEPTVYRANQMPLIERANNQLQQLDVNQKALFADITAAFRNHSHQIRIEENQIKEICNQWLKESIEVQAEARADLQEMSRRFREQGGLDQETVKAYTFISQEYKNYLNLIYQTASRAIELQDAGFDPDKYDALFKVMFDLRQKLLNEYKELIKLDIECRKADFEMTVKRKEMELQVQEQKFNQFIEKEKISLEREQDGYAREQQREVFQYQKQKDDQQLEIERQKLGFKQKKLELQTERQALAHQERILEIKETNQTRRIEARENRPPKQKTGCILQ